MPAIVTFDDPHLPANTALNGGYPTARLDWGSGVWKISPPTGKFGTFHLVLADPGARLAQFRFSAPRIFVGIDVYNGGEAVARTARANHYAARGRASLHSHRLDGYFIASGV